MVKTHIYDYYYIVYIFMSFLANVMNYKTEIIEISSGKSNTKILYFSDDITA